MTGMFLIVNCRGFEISFFRPCFLHLLGRKIRKTPWKSSLPGGFSDFFRRSCVFLVMQNIKFDFTRVFLCTVLRWIHIWCWLREKIIPLGTKGWFDGVNLKVLGVFALKIHFFAFFDPVNHSMEWETYFEVQLNKKKLIWVEKKLFWTSSRPIKRKLWKITFCSKQQ